MPNAGRRTRIILWTATILGLCTAYWQCYEFAYTLTEHGIIESPIWSGTFGAPIPHHYIVGFAVAAAGIIVMELRGRRDRGAKEEPDR